MVLAARGCADEIFRISVVPLLVVTPSCAIGVAGDLIFLLIPVAATSYSEQVTKARYGVGLFTGAITFSRMVDKILAVVLGSRKLSPARFHGRLSYHRGVLICRRVTQNSCWVAAVGAIAFLIAVLFLLFRWLRSRLGQTRRSFAWKVDLLGRDWWRRSRSRLRRRLELARFNLNLSAALVDWEHSVSPLFSTGRSRDAPFADGSGRCHSVDAAVRAERVSKRKCLSALWATASRGIGVSIDYRRPITAGQRGAGRPRTNFESGQAELGTVWFQSHWGFQYYMQQWGAKPLNARDSEITSGDLMIVPANNTAIVAIPSDKVFPPEEQTFAVFPFITTMGRGTGAAFYSSIRGPIPWAIDRIPPEM